MNTASQSSNRGLFVTHEGFGNSIFRTQVIEHCLSMEREGYAFDVLTYETFPKHWPVSVLNLRNFDALLTSLRIILRRAAYIYFPLSTLVNLIILGVGLAKLQRGGAYRFLHARTDYTAFLCILLRPLHGLPVIWDCRGDSEDELDFSLAGKGFLIRTVLGSCLRLRQAIISATVRKFASGAVFVSEALRKQHFADEKFHLNEIIPCPVPEEKFNFDPELRSAMRAALSIPESARVFLYSGSTTGYQGLADQVPIYTELLQDEQNFVIVATTEVDEARRIFGDVRSERLIIRKFDYVEMNAVYNAADFAFMLRAPRALNFVSSPTKFGEYCLTGLPVIHNGTIDQVTKVATELGLGRGLEQLRQIAIVPEAFRRQAALKARDYYSRSLANKQYVRLYSNACK